MFRIFKMVPMFSQSLFNFLSKKINSKAFFTPIFKNNYNFKIRTSNWKILRTNILKLY